MKRVLLLLACLLVPTYSWAFPDNAVLETFTGSDDTTPPNSNWTNGWAGAATGAMRIRSNAATGTVTSTFGDAYWDTSTFGAQCEAFVTIVSVTGLSTAQLGCRLVNIGANTTDGYSITANKSTNRVTIFRRDNGVATQLGDPIVKTISAGDSFGIRTIGSNICAWYKGGVSAWGQIGCRTDGTYSAGGAIGAGVNGTNTTGAIDSFGGGTATACSGASPTWAALALDQASVQDCIDVATTGDTINLPAGTATWTTEEAAVASVRVNKGVTIHGETVCSGSPVTCDSGTVINDGTAITGSSDMLNITGTNSRITGIRFIDTRVNADDSQPEVVLNCANCRIDHCAFTRTNAQDSRVILAYSRVDATQLIDHNYFKNQITNVYGRNGTLDAGMFPGTYSWNNPMTPGDANATYEEDNNFDDTVNNISDGVFDDYSGARHVFRNNTVTNSTSGAHGLDSGGLRSTLRMEVYRNTFTNNGTTKSNTWNTRGGFFLMFLNVIGGSGSYTNPFWVQNYRSDGTSCVNCGTWGTLCGGGATGESAVNPIDQNTSTYASNQGYACRDQVGRGPSTDPANDWPIKSAATSVFSQPLLPSYGWGNLFNGSAPTTSNYAIFTGADGGNSTRLATYHMLRNRDFYQEAASFTGATGTGTGTHAARPATCTTGVAYWETDTGEWDSTNGATADGRLFKCTSTDTWTLYYTPYTYPHPLQAFEAGGGGGGLPTAPTNLRLISQAHNNSACLTWTASGMTNLMGYRVYHGTASGAYTLAAEIPLTSYATHHSPVTQHCYQSALGGTHYFSVTAYDNGTLESDLATEVSATFTALSRDAASARGVITTRGPLE